MIRTSSIGLWTWAACAIAVSAAPHSFAQSNATETSKCTASDNELGDRFGDAVATSGDVVVIGAPDDDDAGSSSGSAYIYHFDGINWIEQPKVAASDPGAGDNCGFSVSTDGTVAVFGAPGDSHAGTDSGSAYIFRLNGGSWDEEIKLTAIGAFLFDNFGDAVSNDGSVVLIGAPQPLFGMGKVFVYRYSAPDWIEESILTPLDPNVDDQFGDAVAIKGNTALIGAHHDGEAAEKAGAAYIFRYSGSSWSEGIKLMASDPAINAGFGREVALSGDGNVAVVAANSDAPVADSGKVYVFRFNGSEWEEVILPTPIGAAADDEFGRYVSVVDDLIVVGAPFDDGLANGTGAAYLYEYNSTNWALVAKLTASDAEEGATLGMVSIDAQNVLVGAPQQGSGGAAYVYGGLTDCNNNQILDLCDIADGSPDADGNGVPDECEGSSCPWDIVGDDNEVTVTDFFALIAAWGTDPGGPPDFDGNGDVNVVDFFDLIAHWGPCP